MRNFTSQSKRSWDDLLPYAEFSLNNAVNASTGYSPFYLMYGAHPRTLVTVKVPNTNLPALEQVFASRDACLADLQRLIRSAVARHQHYADRRRSPHTFDRGLACGFPRATWSLLVTLDRFLSRKWWGRTRPNCGCLTPGASMMCFMCPWA